MFSKEFLLNHAKNAISDLKSWGPLTIIKTECIIAMILEGILHQKDVRSF
jgi:hypothetical protein